MVKWLIRCLYAIACVLTADYFWLLIWILYEIWNELNDIEEKIGKYL